MLKPEVVACRLCGVGVPPALRVEPAYEVRGMGRVRVGDKHVAEAGLCGDCATLRPDEPGAAVRALIRLAGLDESAWVEAAPLLLGAAAASGEPLPPDPYREDGWADFPAPVVDAAEVFYQQTEPQARPWAHVDKALVKQVKKVWPDVLYARVASGGTLRGRVIPPTGPEPSPDDSPCAFCGRLESETWFQSTPSPDALGPRTNPDLRTVMLCEACGDALAEVGAFGPRAVARAFLAHRGVDLDVEDLFARGGSLPGLAPWLASGAEPGEPWGWVGEVVLPEPPPTVESLARRVAALEARLS